MNFNIPKFFELGEIKMTGGVSRFWSKWILGKFDRGGGMFLI